MHRNTYLLVIILAVVVALLIGVNIGKRFFISPNSSLINRPSIPPTVFPSPTPLISYINDVCGFSFLYPSSFTKMDNASGSALLIDPDSNESITVTCQKDIPRRALPPEKIETKIVSNQSRSASISAKLYHDTSAKDGTPLDVLIFRNPKNGLDIFLAGTGITFQKIINSLFITL
ncbi:hypothetical protein HY948_01865 [Candidatus Gottesmanbacteria bacterium]|nr:hypothetical protein [Candidatus Gottesmanbacteria bacterium]